MTKYIIFPNKRGFSLSFYKFFQGTNPFCLISERSITLIMKDSFSLGLQGILKGITLMMLMFFSVSGNSQTDWCEINTDDEPRHGLAYPDCDLTEREFKCVKIKFHYLNNTDETSESLSDQEFASILDELNRAYFKSKIKFDFDGECIQRGDLGTDEYNTAFSLYPLVADPITGVPYSPLDVNYNNNMQYLAGYLNVYFCQTLGPVGTNIGVFETDVVFVKSSSSGSQITSLNSHLVHEIGHILGLRHTMGSVSINPTVPVHKDCLCKDPAAAHNNHDAPACEWVQDCLCDTGLDPFGMDLDGDTYPDKEKWVINGRQLTSLFPSYTDGCDDSTTPWNIPANNFMSYYISSYYGRNSFSPCQMALMHDILDELQTDLLMPCGSNDLYGICADIIISEVEEWSNTTIELCRGQNIIITRDGSLTLDNVILTVGELPASPSISCPDLKPDLVHYWGGIVVDNRLKPEGDNNPAELIVKNHSVIEYAKIAISIPYSMGKVNVEESTIQHCYGIVDAAGRDEIGALLPTILVYPEGEGADACYNEIGGSSNKSIVFTDCTLATDEINEYVGNARDQIKLNGISILLNNTTLENNEPTNFVGINSSRGRVKVVNGSQILNYSVGIKKQMDVLNLCSPRGLVVENSSILDGNVAILSTASNITLAGSYFNKSVITDGLAYQSIWKNHFNSSDGVLDCRNTRMSNLISENYFAGPFISLDGLNNETIVTCNEWFQNYSNLGIEVQDDSELPMAWGLFNQSSGNINDNNPRPSLEWNDTGAGIINYYQNGPTPAIFNYSGIITGQSASGNICHYDE